MGWELFGKVQASATGTTFGAWRRRRLQLVVACWLLALPGAVPLAADVSIAAIAIPGVLQPDRQGAYDKVLARLGELAGQHWQFELLPAKRTTLVLTQAKGCAFPYDLRHFNEINAEQKAGLISSEPFNIATVFLFTRPGTAPITTFLNDPQFRLGARRGLPYGAEFEQLLAKHPERVSLVETDDSSVQMLLANRIDGMLAYFPDMSGYYRDHPTRPMLSYNPAKPIILHRDSVVCPATEANRRFIAALNSGLTKLKASSELEEILDLYYVKP